jgi:hypothetical protein
MHETVAVQRGVACFIRFPDGIISLDFHVFFFKNKFENS